MKRCRWPYGRCPGKALAVVRQTQAHAAAAVAGRATVIVGMFPTGRAAGNGLLEYANDGTAVTSTLLSTGAPFRKESVYVTDRLQVHSDGRRAILP